MDMPDDPLLLADALRRLQALSESAERQLDSFDAAMLYWNLLLAAVFVTGVNQLLLLWIGFIGNLLWFYVRRGYLVISVARRSFFDALECNAEERAAEQVRAWLPAALTLLYLIAGSLILILK